MIDALDITPSPRVLRMLGQIDFAPWQCLAELIDNSIDAFVDSATGASTVAEPRIEISLPSTTDIERGTAAVVIQDNALGMTPEQLGSAVKAGYSGNDPVEKMGLFGMGFNISTARLGRRTEVWTTRADSDEWIGIIVDFDELEKRGTFHVPLRRRQKSAEDLAVAAHGTVIRVSRLEPDRIRPLLWGRGKSSTRKRLGKIYGRVMSTRGITITFDGDVVKPWRHCVWSPQRSVPTVDFGNVPAQIEINRELPPRRFCSTCWVWLEDRDAACNACGTLDHVINRRRTIRGWIGIQRFFDKEHYGIDLLRNGRVIEELDKSLFTFRDPNTGDDVFEYPRDAVHWGGRIVGELEIDFVRVSHQKDSFDKLDPEWRAVVEEVRGASPLQPMIAQRMGLAQNVSPLARLFAGYRKGKAGLKDLVPGDPQGNGLNSGLVREYVGRFYEDEAEYQDDSKWYDLVLQAERINRGESSGADEAAGELPEISGPTPPSTTAPPPPTSVPPEPPDASEVDTNLSRVYELETLAGKPAISVRALRHTSKPVDDIAYRVEPSGATLQFDFYPRAYFFETSLVSPADCLLIDLAQHFLALSSSSPRSIPVSRIASELRKKYFPQLDTGIDGAVDSADALLRELRTFLDEHLPSVAPLGRDSLPEDLIAQVRLRAYSNDAVSGEQLEELLRGGQFVRYVDNTNLILLVERWPALVMDGRLFALPYVDEPQDLRHKGASSLLAALDDARWLAEEAGSQINRDGPWKLQYGKALASMRLLQHWQA